MHVIDMYLVGQENNKKIINTLVDSDVKFIIIQGPKNYGKGYLSKYMARVLDVDFVALDFKVETIRQLVFSSDKNNECLYYFDNFEKSSPAAKSALLKIAEETPKGVYIVISINTSSFLDTLLSRAFIIYMEPYTTQQLIDYNDKLGLSNELFDELLLLGINTPTKLLNLSKVENIKDIMDLVVTYGELIKTNKLDDISIAKIYKQFKTSYNITEVDECYLFLDLLRYYVVKINNVNTLERLDLIEQSMMSINDIPSINRQFIASELFREMRSLQ